jgi:hypothetical protein
MGSLPALIQKPCDHCGELAVFDLHNLYRDEHMVLCTKHFLDWMDAFLDISIDLKADGPA